jgi:hypothetical protein
MMEKLFISHRQTQDLDLTIANSPERAELVLISKSICSLISSKAPAEAKGKPLGRTATSGLFCASQGDDL